MLGVLWFGALAPARLLFSQPRWSPLIMTAETITWFIALVFLLARALRTAAEALQPRRGQDSPLSPRA